MIVRSYESMGDKTTYIEGLFIESTKDEAHHLLQLTRVVVDGQKQSCPVGATVKVLSDKARQNSTTLYPKLEYYSLMDWVRAMDSAL